MVLPQGASNPPPTGPVTNSPADARPDYVTLLNNALGPRPELHGFRKVASILGPALMAAAGNQAGANAMIEQLGQPGRQWDERNREAQLTGIKWRREDDLETAKRNEPTFLSGNTDQVRYDPATGSATRVYDAPEPFEDYAHSRGLEPGTPDYFKAVEDYVLRGNGPTAFQYDKDLETVRQAGRLSQQRARQAGALSLENLRQHHRTDIRGLPTYRDTHPQPRAAAGPSAAAHSTLPLARTPAEALKLPPGTHFRTPDGAVKVRP
jgi:hypothetical protein